MKQIVRQYSMDILKQISGAHRMHWLIPPEARENQVQHFQCAHSEQFVIDFCCVVYRWFCLFDIETWFEQESVLIKQKLMVF